MNNTSSPIKIIVLLIIVLVGGYWFYSRSATQTETGSIITEVSKKVLVPTEVTPKLVTLTTLEQLRGQTFFRQAALGDVILMYPETVILYRPSIQKVITIGSIDPTVAAQLFSSDPAALNSLNAPSASDQAGAVDPNAPAPTGPIDPNAPVATTPAPADTTPIGVEIRNGTATSGLAKKLSDKLSANPLVKVPTTGNASNTQYTQTTIVNPTGSPLPASITDIIKGAQEVTALPTGEKAIDGNSKILVIIGTDISSKVSGL